MSLSEFINGTTHDDVADDPYDELVNAMDGIAQRMDRLEARIEQLIALLEKPPRR